MVVGTSLIMISSGSPESARMAAEGEFAPDPTTLLTESENANLRIAGEWLTENGYMSGAGIHLVAPDAASTEAAGVVTADADWHVHPLLRMGSDRSFFDVLRDSQLILNTLDMTYSDANIMAVVPGRLVEATNVVLQHSLETEWYDPQDPRGAFATAEFIVARANPGVTTAPRGQFSELRMMWPGDHGTGWMPIPQHNRLPS